MKWCSVFRVVRDMSCVRSRAREICLLWWYKENHESKRCRYACSQATDKLTAQPSNFGLHTCHDGASGLVSEFLPLGCLSRLRQEENGLLDQERSPSREKPCCGRQRDTHASWFAQQHILSRQRLDNRADHRSFTCTTQPCSFVVLLRCSSLLFFVVFLCSLFVSCVVLFFCLCVSCVLLVVSCSCSCSCSCCFQLPPSLEG